MPNTSPQNGPERDARSLLERLERRHEQLLAKIDDLHEQVAEALSDAARPSEDAAAHDAA